MPTFAGLNHVALTVRDLDVSQRFYCDLLDFTMVLDIGHGRLCIHRATGFTIALLRPEGVPCSPIQDMPLGHHLNFTDPDGIALELQAPNALYLATLDELRTTDLSDDEIRARAAALLAAPTMS